MGSPSDQFEQELYQRIDEVLHYLWDPLGVARDPFARDEYTHYVPDVFTALLDNADGRRIMELLLLLETEFLDLSPRPSHAWRIAELLVEWRRSLEHKYGGPASF
jgi:hypothetical protein